MPPSRGTAAQEPSRSTRGARLGVGAELEVAGGSQRPPARMSAMPLLGLVGSWPAQNPPLDLPGLRESWLDMLREALASIELAAPAVDDGPGVEPLLRALEDAVTRGVRVRVLAGGGRALSRLRARRIEVREARRSLDASWFVVDGGEAGLGGRAFESGDDGAPALAVRLLAPRSVRAIADAFESDWTMAEVAPPRGGYQFPEPAVAGVELAADPAEAWLNVTPLFRSSAETRLAALIDAAHAAVRMRASQPGVLAGPLGEALARAAARGLDVEVLAPDAAELDPPHGLRLRAIARESGAPPPDSGAPAFAVVDSKSSFISGGDLPGLSGRSVALLVEGAPVARVLERFFVAESPSSHMSSLR